MDKEYKKQRVVCLFLSFLLCFTPIVSSLNVIFNVFLGGISLNTGLLYIIYFVLMVAFLFSNIRYMPKKLLCALAFFFVSYFSTVMFFPQNVEYMWTTVDDILTNPTYIFLFFVISGFIAGFYFNEMELFISIFEKFSVVTVALLATRFFMGFIIRSSMPEYMTFSYNLLLPTTFVLLLCIKEFRVYRAVVAILGVGLIFVAGCRGALLGVVISPLIYIFFFGKLEKNIKCRTTILLIAFLLVVLFFYDPILQAVSSKLTSIGLNSRTLEMLLNSTITDDSSRGQILQNAMSQIGFLGYGLWGDRVILNGIYPHNIIVEILIDYGWILGSGLLILMTTILIRGFIKAGTSKSVVMCALFSSGIVRLLLSGSYLGQEPAFYVLISLCLSEHGDTYNKTIAKTMIKT